MCPPVALSRCRFACFCAVCSYSVTFAGTSWIRGALLPGLIVLDHSASRFSNTGDPERAPRVGCSLGAVHYWPPCALIVSSICFFTASRLNEAGSCIGG